MYRLLLIQFPSCIVSLMYCLFIHSPRRLPYPYCIGFFMYTIPVIYRLFFIQSFSCTILFIYCSLHIINCFFIYRHVPSLSCIVLFMYSPFHIFSPSCTILFIHSHHPVSFPLYTVLFIECALHIPSSLYTVLFIYCSLSLLSLHKKSPSCTVSFLYGPFHIHSLRHLPTPSCTFPFIYSPINVISPSCTVPFIHSLRYLTTSSMYTLSQVLQGQVISNNSEIIVKLLYYYQYHSQFCPFFENEDLF